SVQLLVTFRTVDEAWRERAKSLIQSRIEGIAAAHGATTELLMPAGYPVLMNDSKVSTRARETAGIYMGTSNIRELDRRMCSEDFSFYTHEVAGCFFRLGTNRQNTTFTHAVHTPQFDIDESALSTGAGILAWLTLCELGG